MTITTAVTAAVLMAFKLLELLDVVPDDWYRRLKGACAAVIVVALVLFQTEFTSAVELYAREKAQELAEWFQPMLEPAAPTTDAPPEPVTATTEP